MPALAITDHGNMFGVKEFFKFAAKHPAVKPIIGCEIYVTTHYDHTLKDNDHRKYYHLILLAKNYNGYKNLMKIVSTSHIEGMYYKPRVCHEVIEKYHEDLICCSACLAGEVPKAIMSGNLDAAREAIRWHREVFGDDYYLEVMLHKSEVPGLDMDVYEHQGIKDGDPQNTMKGCAFETDLAKAYPDARLVITKESMTVEGMIKLTYDLLKDKLNIVKITFKSGDNTASEEYPAWGIIDRCPMCGVALDENGVCYKCGYSK